MVDELPCKEVRDGEIEDLSRCDELMPDVNRDDKLADDNAAAEQDCPSDVSFSSSSSSPYDFDDQEELDLVINNIVDSKTALAHQAAISEYRCNQASMSEEEFGRYASRIAAQPLKLVDYACQLEEIRDGENMEPMQYEEGDPRAVDGHQAAMRASRLKWTKVPPDVVGTATKTFADAYRRMDLTVAVSVRDYISAFIDLVIAVSFTRSIGS